MAEEFHVTYCSTVPPAPGPGLHRQLRDRRQSFGCLYINAALTLCPWRCPHGPWHCPHGPWRWPLAAPFFKLAHPANPGGSPSSKQVSRRLGHNSFHIIEAMIPASNEIESLEWLAADRRLLGALRVHSLPGGCCATPGTLMLVKGKAGWGAMRECAMFDRACCKAAAAAASQTIVIQRF